MTWLRLRHLLVLIALLAFTDSAWAQTFSKLDPRVRAARAGLRSGFSVSQLRENSASINASGDLDVFIQGSVSRAELEAAGAIVRSEAAGVFTASIPEGAVDAVAALAGVTRITGAAPCEYTLDASVPTTGANLLRGPGPTFTGLNGAGILVGDVDSGIDYDHGDFRDAANNTRLVNIWDQTVGASPPAGFAIGTEWSQAQIDAHTATQVDVSGHGTHVMGIAAGDGSATGGSVPPFTYVGMAPMADLIEVKTTLATTDVFDGVSYIFQRATALGKKCVCNLSLGSQFGPHDGSSAFESGLSGLVGPGRIVVCSAGNDRSVARHAEVKAAGTGTNVTMTVSGSGLNRTVAIDGYYEASEAINVRITTPNASVIGPITLGNANAAYPGQSTLNGNVYLENGVSTTPGGAREVYVEINMASGQNANGTWTFTFIPVSLGATLGEVDLWRFFHNTSTANFVTGNQPTEELVSEPANATGVITAAAWTSKRFWTDCNSISTISFNGSVNPGLLSPFSSPGPTRDNRNKPDIAAPGSAIGSATSFDIAQSCSPGASVNVNDGMQHTMNQGTSMAAPHVTGAAALLLQKFGAVDPVFIKNFLTSRASTSGTGVVWNKDWGNGKLFLGDLTDPSVTVTSPDGGEVLTVGSPTNLTWNASDATGVSGVDIYLSRAGVGGPYETIALGQPNSGSYNWNPTGPPTTNAILKVVASDPAGNSGNDVSNAEWTIDTPVPALLSIFDATGFVGGISVRWAFANPDDVAESHLERSDMVSGPWSTVDVERSSADGVETAVDRDAVAGKAFFYRLVATDRSGDVRTFGPLTAQAQGQVFAFGIARVWPNPTSDNVNVEFTLARESAVRLTVVDVRGRTVAELANGRFTPGPHTVSWSNAAKVGSGLYFLHYATEEGDFVKRTVRVQ